MEQAKIKEGTFYALKILSGLAVLQVFALLTAFFGGLEVVFLYPLVGLAILLIVSLVFPRVMAGERDYPWLPYFLSCCLVANLALLSYAFGNSLLLQVLWVIPVLVSSVYANQRLTIYTLGFSLLAAIICAIYRPIHIDFTQQAQAMISTILVLMALFGCIGFIIKRYAHLFLVLKEAEAERVKQFEEYRELLDQVLKIGKTVSVSRHELVKKFKEADASAVSLGENVVTAKDNLSKIIETMRNTKSTVRRNMTFTKDTVRIIEDIVSNAGSGMAMSKEMDTVIDGFKDKLNQTFATFKKSGEQIVSIQTIVETINEISGQINLLSLNAAIEAVRAGEHGRGFSVIAESIQTLSNQTKEALNKINGILGKIFEQTEKVQIESKATGKLFTEVLEVIFAVHRRFTDMAERLNQRTPVLLKLSDFLQAQKEIMDGINNEVDSAYNLSASTEEGIAGMKEVITEVEKTASGLNSAADQLLGLTKRLTSKESSELV